MGSKKQRARAAKEAANPGAREFAKKLLNMPTPTGPKPPGPPLERAPILPGHVSPGNSPFMRKLPGEIRDKIYEELLIVKMTPEMRDTFEQKMDACEMYGDYGRERVQDDYDQEIGLMPGGTQNYGSRFIGKNKGILLANKQIYEEATDVLFGKNRFVILAESERVWSFWRCDSMGCKPVGRPCYVRGETATKVKHLTILVNNPRLTTDDELLKDSFRLNQNLEMIVDTLTLDQVNIKLKTLKVRYWTCFEGEVESVRQELEGPVRPGMPDRPITIRDINSKFHTIRRKDADQFIFRHCAAVLKPLLKFKGRADDVSVRGDLPQTLVHDLVKVMTVDDPSAVAKKKAKEKAASKQKQPRNASSSLAEFAREQLEKNPDADQGMKDLYQQLMRTSVKSPSFMAELCKPPTKEEMEGIRGQRRARQPLDSMEDPSDEEEQTGSVDTIAAGGIGLIAGKPVFGPARPPAGGS